MFVYKNTETIEYILKVAYFLRKIWTSGFNNSQILSIENSKFFG